MKYYIRMTDKRLGIVKYKRNKCVDGFAYDKDKCWKFTKQGAKKIIERLKNEYRMNINNIEFDLEEVEA